MAAVTNNHIRIKQLLFIAVLFAIIPVAYSGNRVNPIWENQDTVWKFDQSVNSVEFFYAISVCNGQNVVFLKLRNKNNFPVEVSWKDMFETQLEKAAEGVEGRKKIVVQPGDTFESDCRNPRHKEFVILASKALPTYIATISAFKYKDVTVIKTN